ncbi:hypothetical protein SY87_32915 [Burkholderia pseudomallei]|nr:hypothetical protein SY87_33595 [Burkholderia pseudomallei]KIX33599.1 hypothetical protein SY87_33415 [Burkholderia pseudomallei]KIX35356.1 hypothetical protein SY87_32915 [Burkholderia pseudomallei]
MHTRVSHGEAQVAPGIEAQSISARTDESFFFMVLSPEGGIPQRSAFESIECFTQAQQHDRRHGRGDRIPGLPPVMHALVTEHDYCHQERKR